MVGISFFGLLVAPWLALAEEPATAPPAAAAAAAGKVGVLPIAGKLPKPRLQEIEDAFDDVSQTALVLPVVLPSDVRATLPPGKQKAFMKCKKPACFAKAASALGVDWLVSTRARRAKGKVQLMLQIMDKAGVVLGKNNITLDGEEVEAGVQQGLAGLRSYMSATPGGGAPPPAAAAEATPPAGAPSGEAPAQPAASSATPAAETAAASPSATPPAETEPPPDDAAPAANAGKSTAPGWIGMRYVAVDDEVASEHKLDSARGALVEALAPSGPADSAGVHAGDIIVALGSQPIADPSDLHDRLAPLHAGDQIVLTVWREGIEIRVTFQLGTKPAAS